MIEIHVKQDIDVPTEKVFSFIADFENNPRWQKGMQSAVFTSEGELRVGSTYDQVAHFLGREIRTSFEVIEFEPGRSVAIESRSGPFPIRVRRAVEPLTSGTRVTADVSGDPTGFFRLAKPLMQAMVRRSVVKDYEQLRALLEEAS